MATAIPDPGTPARPRRTTLLFLLPLVVFAGLGVFLALGLGRDPGALPSTLVGKPAPPVDLPPIPGRDEAGLKSADLRGKPMLVNVFASWCVPCRVEAPVLDRLKDEGVTIQGIDYKDQPADVTAWLKDLGDPFAKVGLDRKGTTAIDWGVYGVPETFVLDRDGRVAYKFVGPLQPRDVGRVLKPLLARLEQQ